MADEPFAVLEKEPARGPARDWEDQRWTPARIRVLIARRFRMD
ncbi:hypothetical protein [Streptomyces sp. SAI-127]|nr:hypothetical protein [Streptomyces sp. SAI-127]MDH6484682.1 hypothetical protein [Streptomyces sp. SAI-127]